MHSPSTARETTDESVSLLPQGSEEEEEASAKGANAFTPVITVLQPHVGEVKEKLTEELPRREGT